MNGLEANDSTVFRVCWEGEERRQMLCQLSSTSAAQHSVRC